MLPAPLWRGSHTRPNSALVHGASALKGNPGSTAGAPLASPPVLAVHWLSVHFAAGTPEERP
jgi:hypothetical protein